ncbi:MAG: response regulator [Acidobacteriota bacterium]|nr:response regulator [Acidobacteriota bacterium]
MTYVLIVEDSPDQALVMSGLLEEAGYSCQVVTGGREALAALEMSPPDIVVTDLVMPEVDGLKLVEVTTERYPTVPVILVTAYGSGEVAVRALKKGAASYIPKRRLVAVLVSTVEDVLSVSRERVVQLRTLDFLVESRFRFSLGNDQEVIAGVVSFIQDQLRSRYATCTENTCLHVGMAVREALRNAMHHGNLEVESTLREVSSGAYDEKVSERLADGTYADRDVELTVTFESDEFHCIIRDEGSGFDPSLVPDPTDPENLMRASGRGLYLISAFMDQMKFNSVGNEISMTKRMRGEADSAKRASNAGRTVV